MVKRVPPEAALLMLHWQKKDATSGFTDSNYSAMLDILSLYAKLISSAEFTLEAPYGGTARSDVTRGSPNSFSGRIARLRP